MRPGHASMAPLVALLVALGIPRMAAADDSGRSLASPWGRSSIDAGPAAGEPVPSSHASAAPAHGDGPMFDLEATTLVPLSVGGAMHFEWQGIFIRAAGSVVVPAYVDGINDVGEGYGLWDDATGSSISELLVDSIVIEAAAGIRPLGGPFELSVGYFMLWSEGPGPVALGMNDRVVSVSVYAVHGELAIRMPLGDAMVMRIGLGWLHGVGRDVTIAAMPDESESARAGRQAAEATLGNWISQYGMGPTLSAGLGMHFQ